MIRGSPNRDEGAELVARRYARLGPLSSEELELFTGLTILEDWLPREEIALEGAVPAPRFIVSGWAARVRFLADGRRQIIAFVLPGDGLGVCERPGPLALTSTIALTPTRTLDGARLVAALRSETHTRYAPLREALRVATALDETFLINHIVRNGRQTAYERLCHLIQEIHWRLSFAGLASADALPWPPTQEILADALGISIVHVNRMLQQGRRDGLFDIRAGQLRIFNPAMMSSISEFAEPRPTDFR